MEVTVNIGTGAHQASSVSAAPVTGNVIADAVAEEDAEGVTEDAAEASADSNVEPFEAEAPAEPFEADQSGGVASGDTQGIDLD
jgi:hypothetical protein